MNKTIKLILIGAFIALTLCGLGLWYAASSINPAQLTKLLSSSVKSATGRDLVISGPVSLKVIPNISVTANQVSLSNASWASDSQMITLKHVEMDIKLLPLLKGSVEVSGMRLSGIDAHLQTNKAGLGNWEIAAPINAGNSSSLVSSTNEAQTPTTSGDSAFVAIENVDITDARISYSDTKTPSHTYYLQQFSANRSGSKTSVVVDAQYEGYKLNIKGKISLLRQTIIDWDRSPIKMDVDLVATLNGKTLNIEGVINKSPKSLPQFDIALNSKSFNLLPIAGSAALASKRGGPRATSSGSERGGYFFSVDPLPFDLLPEADGKISLNVAELIIPHQVPLNNLKADAIFKNQSIEINDLSFSLGKGSALGRIAISQFHGPNPAVKMKWMAQGFTWEQMISAADSNSKVVGGQIQVAGNVEGSGSSLHRLVGGARGEIQITVGHATLANKYLNEGGDLVVSILGSINPMQKKSSQTILECGVAYLPINNGVISVNNSIGVETDRLNVTGSGTINLATEMINLSIDPKEKSGLTTGLDLGGLVKLQGSLQHPQAALNQAGVVNSAVNIGLGFLTAGVSIAAENAKSMLTKTQPCKTALHPWSDIYPGPTK